MLSTSKHRTVNQIDVSAPADVVYGIITDPVRWPQYFGPTVHVERAEIDADAERLEIWAMIDGEIRAWSSIRVLDPERRRVSFQQEICSPPVRFMGGTWTVAPRPGGRVRLVLTHEFEAAGDERESLERLARVAEENGAAELATIKNLAERWPRRDEFVFSFEDSVLVDGPPAAIYAFLHDAGEWPRRLPHVAKMELRDEPGNLQLMAMHTRMQDGSVHVTESARICFPDERIVYKQLVTHELIDAHIGEWSLTRMGEGIKVCGRHAVTLNESAVAAGVRAGTTSAAMREMVREAIGGNIRIVLDQVRKFAETPPWQ
jgi:ribosome-associated toxin RatA of RatAB toxin-antitoxin module